MRSCRNNLGSTLFSEELGKFVNDRKYNQYSLKGLDECCIALRFSPEKSVCDSDSEHRDEEELRLFEHKK
jgi:hypothetical protein